MLGVDCPVEHIIDTKIACFRPYNCHSNKSWVWEDLSVATNWDVHPIDHHPNPSTIAAIDVQSGRHRWVGWVPKIPIESCCLHLAGRFHRRSHSWLPLPSPWLQYFYVLVLGLYCCWEGRKAKSKKSIPMWKIDLEILGLENDCGRRADAFE